MEQFKQQADYQMIIQSNPISLPGSALNGALRTRSDNGVARAMRKRNAMKHLIWVFGVIGFFLGLAMHYHFHASSAHVSSKVVLNQITLLLPGGRMATLTAGSQSGKAQRRMRSLVHA